MFWDNPWHMFNEAMEVFLVFLRLGCTSFGGPIAHLGYFHRELIQKRHWLEENSYADLVALCQFLPGPASSQIGIAIGLHRAGPTGAIAAWLGFTLPSVLLLIAVGYGVTKYEGLIPVGILHGLKLAAVPIVAHALWSMGKKLCTGWIRPGIAIFSAIFSNALPFGFGQVAVILIGSICGRLFLNDTSNLPHVPIKPRLSRAAAAISLLTLASMLLLLPQATRISNLQSIRSFDSFFRAGSLVFGGGHVVLPLLKAEVVSPGWVAPDAFMVGYGAAQAIPGPLFAFSAYLGTVAKIPPNGIFGALVCLVAAFLPSFFLVFGTLPFWEQIRNLKGMRSALQGINAAVVGLLLAAFIDPVCTSSILSYKDFGFALVGFLLLLNTKIPSWTLVGLSAFYGYFF